MKYLAWYSQQIIIMNVRIAIPDEHSNHPYSILQEMHKQTIKRSQKESSIYLYIPPIYSARQQESDL